MPNAGFTLADRIPGAMAQLPRWVTADDHKVPHNPRTGLRASPTNRVDWGTFEEATAAATRRGHRLGFVLTSRDPFVLVDIDKCRDPLTGTLEPWATDILARFPGTYAEVSMSGTGIHIIGTMTHPLPAGRRRAGGIEIYDDARYIVMTGDVLPGHERLGDVTEAVVALHAETFPPSPPRPPRGVTGASPTGATLEDDELLERARSARDGGAFDALWRGDTTGYASHSEADMALANRLAFWCGPDPDRIDRLFRQSDLMRDKWDSRRGAQSYGEITVAKALADCREVYTAPGRITVSPVTAPTGGAAGDPAATDTCRLEVLELTQRIATLETEVARLKLTNAAIIQVVINPHLKESDKITVLAVNGLMQQKRARGETGPDGTVVISAAEVSNDWRPTPSPGDHVAPHNTDGSLPRMARSRVKPTLGTLTSRGIIPATPRTELKPRASGQPYRETVWTIPASSPADFLGPAATWRPEEPVARKPRRVAVPCSSCGEVHPVIRTDVCGGCGTIRDRRTIEPGDDLEAATTPTLPPSAPTSNKLSDNVIEGPLHPWVPPISNNLSEAPGTSPPEWSAQPAQPGVPGSIAAEWQAGGGRSTWDPDMTGRGWQP